MATYFGKYRGKVINNIDPRRLGRLLVQVPDIMPTPMTNWAMPCVPYAGSRVGFLALPPIGANVWVEFEAGNLASPIWSGGFWTQLEAITDAIGPNVKILKTDTATIKIDDLLMTLSVEVTTAAGPMSITINSQGIEAKLQYDYGIDRQKDYQNPYYISFTYTNAELNGDSNSTDAESIFSGGVDGNKVPYVPEFQFAAGTGIEFGKWGVFADATYVGETFTTADNVSNPFEKSGTPDARFGKTDNIFYVDLSGYYKINDNAKIVANLHNVGNSEYIVSRHPHGPRPGKPFTATAGMEITF